jgi:hypothetical protein
MENKINEKEGQVLANNSQLITGRREDVNPGFP